MKNFRINKLFKSLLSVFLIVLMTIPINVFASTNSKGQPAVDPSTAELISIFPEFKTSLDKNTTGELVSNTETYYKFIPKSNSNANIEKVYTNKADIEKDFYVKEYTKQEYEVEVKNDKIQQAANKLLEMSAQSIGDQEGGNYSWFRVILSVYNSTGGNTYMAYCFGSWLTSPSIRLNDAIGISVSTGMTISDDVTTRYSTYNHPDLANRDTYENGTVKFTDAAKGVLAQYKLASVYKEYYNEYHNFMISTGINYSNSNTSNGWIFGNYLHSELAFGSISINSAGLPSVSFDIVSSLCQAGVFVSR